MNCIKCGRALRGEEVFCFECQEEMENNPVKPGTPVQLPVHPVLPETKAKSPRIRKTLPPEMRIHRMRNTIRLLALALAAALLAFVVTSLLVLHLLDQRDHQSRTGQNYRIIAEE